MPCPDPQTLDTASTSAFVHLVDLVMSVASLVGFPDNIKVTT